MQNNPSAVKKH